LTIDDLLDDKAPKKESTYDKVINLLQAELATDKKLAKYMYGKAEEQGISERTLKEAKKALGLNAFKIGKQWYWPALPA